MGFASFLIRFIAYTVALAIPFAIAQYFWSANGLDNVGMLAGFHAAVVTVVMIAPIVLSVLASVARPAAIFVLCYLIGAILTAPFVVNG